MYSFFTSKDLDNLVYPPYPGKNKSVKNPLFGALTLRACGVVILYINFIMEVFF